MSIFVSGKSVCWICEKVLHTKNADQGFIGFPAFLPQDHRLGRFSDVVMHDSCFWACPESTEVEALYKEFEKLRHELRVKWRKEITTGKFSGYQIELGEACRLFWEKNT